MVATVPLLPPNHIYWMVELGGALVHTIDWIWSTHIWFLFLSILISTIYGYDTSTNSQPYLLDGWAWGRPGSHHQLDLVYSSSKQTINQPRYRFIETTETLPEIEIVQNVWLHQSYFDGVFFPYIWWGGGLILFTLFLPVKIIEKINLLDSFAL